MTTTIDRNKYACETTKQERKHDVNGVPGRLHNLVRHKSGEPNQRMIRNQKWTSERRTIPGTDGERIQVTIRHDDELLNGHPSFSVTADIIDKKGRDIGGGCCHDTISKVFPELASLCKWHLCSNDGPMHYPANVLFLAGDRDCWGRTKGEPSRYDYKIYFGSSPMGHAIKKSLAEFIDSRKGSGDFHYIGIAHERDPKTYGTHYTIVGFGEKWHECPFRDELAAAEFTDGLNQGDFRIDKVPSDFSEGKERELDAARRSAIWPDATDDQLSAPKQVLEGLLMDRLPSLLAEFREAVESIGFEFE